MTDRIARAQVNATLAIVEQLRIGNLIALGYGGDEADYDQARADARAALVNWHAHEDPEMGGWPEIRPEIAAALGIDQSCNKLAVVEGEHGRSNYAEIWQEAADIARGRS